MCGVLWGSPGVIIRDAKGATIATLSKHKCYDKDSTKMEVINGSHGSYKVG